MPNPLSKDLTKDPTVRFIVSLPKSHLVALKLRAKREKVTASHAMRGLVRWYTGKRA